MGARVSTIQVAQRAELTAPRGESHTRLGTTLTVNDMKRMLSQGRYFSAVLSSLLLAAPVARAQEMGMVQGTVRATGSGTPLSDVTVFVQGTTRGGVTDEQGRFRILAVPTGDRVVMAQLIGRARGTQTVHIAADSAVRVEFALTEVAAVIAPTVVSATREVQRRTDQSTTIDVLEGASIREVRAAHP